MINSVSGNNMNMQQPMDPDKYAEIYAERNGITKEEAIEELKSKYGDPTKDGEGAPQDTFSSSTTNEDSLVDIDFELEDDTDISAIGTQAEEAKGADKDSVADALAKEAGITTDKAKDALKALGIGENSEPADPEEKLADFVKVTGLTEDAAKAFLQKYIGEPEERQ